MTKRQMVADLIAKRSAARDEANKLVETARADNERSLNDDEKALFEGFETNVRELDARIAELDEQVRADEAAAELQKRYAPTVESVKEPEVYRSGPGGKSYFRDLYRSTKKGDREATERLLRNDRMRADQTRAISTSNGAGGEFVPPLWLEDQFIKLARPGRITANLIPNHPLPAGTDSINIPKITTGTAVAPMTTQNSQITQQDLATSSISSSVTTIAGGQTISLQLLEQSPLNIDDVVLGDLAAAYAVEYNTLILSGTGTNAQPTGLLTLAGTNAVDVPASATAATLYAAVADAIQQIHTKRFLPPDTIVMHPRRWAWLVSQVDSTGRPLVTPRANAYNPLGAADNVASQGMVGEMQGLPVYVDAVLPVNGTADSGTGEDVILVMRCADLIQWESFVRAEAFEQTYANQMSVFVRLYNYMSFQPARYPASISKLTGAGLEAPTFAVAGS